MPEMGVATAGNTSLYSFILRSIQETPFKHERQHEALEADNMGNYFYTAVWGSVTYSREVLQEWLLYFINYILPFTGNSLQN